MKARAFAVLISAVAPLLGARPALALCPNCLGQSPSLSPTLRLVGVFLLVPPAVFFVVALVIRRLGRQSASPSAPPSTPPSDVAGFHGA
jgi:hypothetical protein